MASQMRRAGSPTIVNVVIAIKRKLTTAENSPNAFCDNNHTCMVHGYSVVCVLYIYNSNSVVKNRYKNG